jgi:hypothetical protein
MPASRELHSLLVSAINDYMEAKDIGDKDVLTALFATLSSALNNAYENPLDRLTAVDKFKGLIAEFVVADLEETENE